MKDVDPADAPTGRIHLPSWVWFGAFFGAVLEVLDGRVLYSEHLTSTGLAITLLGRAILGSAIGAIVGLIMGGIALGLDPFLPRSRRIRRTRRRPVRAGWLIGLALGSAIGWYNVATSPAKAAHDRIETACTRIQIDLGSAQLALDTHAYLKGAGFANNALSLVAACKKPVAEADEAQAYLLRAISGYQGKLPYLDDGQQAHDLAVRCAQRYRTSNDPLAKRCQDLVEGAQAALTQRYCDASLQLSNDADDSIAHLDFDLGRNEANQAIARAAKCTSAFSYAYRGVGLVKRGMADYLAGQRAHGAQDIASGKQLLDRCLAEVDEDSPQTELRKNCAFQLTTAKAP